MPPVFRARVVRLALLPDPGPDGDASIARFVREGRTVEVEQSKGYSFWVKDLLPGRYRLAAAPGRVGRLREAGSVEVLAAPEETRITIPSPSRSELLVVRAVDPDGESLPITRVFARYEEAGKVLAWSVSESAPEAGAVTVMFRPSSDKGEGLPPFDPVRGRFFVGVTSGSRGTARGTCTVTAEPSIEVVLAEPGSLSVILRGLPEGPIRQRLVGGLAWRGEAGMPHQADPEVLRRGEMLQFWQVQPGEYDFMIRTGLHESAWEIVRVPVTVGGRNQAMRVAVPTLHAVSVKNAPLGIALERIDAPRWNVRLGNSTQSATMPIDGLPPGRYRAVFATSSVDFTLPGDAEIDMGR